MKTFDIKKASEYNKIIKETPKYVNLYVDKSIEIIERIHYILEKKELKQKDLAKILNKKETEISRWINGIQNFTIKTIAKLEEALGEEIIVVSKTESIKLQKEDIETYFNGTATVILQTMPSRPNYHRHTKVEEFYSKKEETKYCKTVESNAI